MYSGSGWLPVVVAMARCEAEEAQVGQLTPPPHTHTRAAMSDPRRLTQASLDAMSASLSAGEERLDTGRPDGPLDAVVASVEPVAMRPARTKPRGKARERRSVGGSGPTAPPVVRVRCSGDAGEDGSSKGRALMRRCVQVDLAKITSS
jgi:hypothetical protein